MAWSTPRTWSVGEVLSASNMNTYVSNDLTWLKGGQSLDVTAGGVWSLTNGGMLGAVAASRYVGATASGNPGSGTFVQGDFIVSKTDHKMRVCTVAGSPGTWTDISANPLATVFTRSGNVVAVSGDYTAAKVTNSVDKTSTTLITFAGGVQSWHFQQGIGYKTGAGGSVSQAAITAPSVTLNRPCGQILTNGDADLAAAGTQYNITVNNTCVDIDDTVILTARYINITKTFVTSPQIVEYWVSEVGSGYFKLSYIYGGDAHSLGEGDGYTFNFAVIKAVTA